MLLVRVPLVHVIYVRFYLQLSIFKQLLNPSMFYVIAHLNVYMFSPGYGL